MLLTAEDSDGAPDGTTNDAAVSNASAFPAVSKY